jgi:RpiR family transcriptional regulator, carbohydrate utilization regulator
MRRAEQAVSPSDTGPVRLHDIIARIKDCYPDLSRAEQSVADAVLSDVQAAVDASNAELAIRAGVSQPSVTRFCRSIGCEGVRDFKLQLARSLVVGEIFLAADNPLPTAEPGATPPFWASVLGEARLALREVERQLDPALVLAAAAILAPARRVLVLGLGGSSSALAEETQNRLFRYGVPVTACKDPYLARMTIATFRPDDVVIAISATGHTREVIDCVGIARTYRVRTIAITTPGSALALAAEIALTTRIAEYPDALTPSASRFAFLTIIDLVAAATGYQMGPLARENLRRIKFNLVEKGAGRSIEPLGD